MVRDGKWGRCEKHLWNREEDEDGGRTVDEWMECGRGEGSGAGVDKHRADKGREAMQAREEQARGRRQAEGRARRGQEAEGGRAAENANLSAENAATQAAALISKRLARLARLISGWSWKGRMVLKNVKQAYF